MGLEELRKEIMEEAEKKIRGILDDAKREAERIIADAEAKAENIVNMKKERVLKDLAEKERSEMAIARIEGKRIIYDSRWRVFDKVFEKVLEKIKEYHGSDEYYKKVLVRFILEGVKNIGSGEVILYLNSKDKEYVSKNIGSISKAISKFLGRNVKLSVGDDVVRIVGGVIVTDPDGIKIFNNSFESRINRAREELAADVFDILFGGVGE
jgi:V/A-type H+-transporting ATPase subunit E